MASAFAILFAVLAFFSCGETKQVEKEVVVQLQDPPILKPEGEIPPLKTPQNDTLENDEVEEAALQDAFSLNAAEAANTVYLSNANLLNLGDDVRTGQRGVDLGINLLSNRSFLKKSRPVDKGKSILAVDLRDIFGSRANVNWKLIEERAIVRIESKTKRFQNLQFLTQKRIPLMHSQIFLETALQAQTYYQLKDIPTLENDFWKQQGIDRQRDFDERDNDIFLAGMADSQIAPDHNRLVRRMLGNNGACWNTYDVDAANVVDGNNYFLNPFPVEARSKKTAIHAAGEILCLQPNGLFVSALYNGAGVRANDAPTTIVVNTRTAALGLDPSITIRDCTGCHTQFILPVRDELRRQIADNAFNAADKILGQLFFKPQAQLDSIIIEDNQRHAGALSQLGINAGTADPINVGLIDKMRDGFNAKELAAFLYISEGEFLQRLAGSGNASQEVGQLLSGGNIGFIQFQDSIQTIIDDLLLFQDIE